MTQREAKTPYGQALGAIMDLGHVGIWGDSMKSAQVFVCIYNFAWGIIVYDLEVRYVYIKSPRTEGVLLLD